MRKLLFTCSAIMVACLAIAQEEKLDADMIQKIRKEGLNNSKVMDIVFYLTEVSGPRLNNSPGYFRAANWAKGELTKYGADDAQLEAWGDWGKGWELEKSYVAMTAPYYRPLIAFPKTWTSSTKGLKSAEVIILNEKDSIE